MENLIFRYARNITLAALFLIPFTPLIVAESLFFPFIVGKAVFFRALVEVAFFGWLFLALFDARYRPRNTGIMSVFLLFTVWLLVADVFAVNSVKALWGNFERMEGWVSVAHLFMFFVVLSSMSNIEVEPRYARYAEVEPREQHWTKDPWHVFWFISLLVSIIVSVAAFIGTENIAGVFGGLRVVGGLGNPTYLAAYSMIHFFVAAFFFAKTRGNFYILAATVNMLTLLFTGTRGALLGLVAGVVVVIVLSVVNRYGAGWRTIFFAVKILLLAAAVFALSHLPFLREAPVFSDIAGITPAAGQTRFTLWKMALEGFKEKPILGWGQEGFNYVFNKYYRPSLFGQEEWFDRAHNEYLDWLVAGGAPAFLLYIVLFFLALAVIWKREKRTPGIVLMGFFAAYGVHSLFVFNVVPASFLFVAILVYSHRLYLQKEFLISGRSSDTGRSLPELAERRVLPVAGAVLALMITTALVVNGRPLEGGSKLISALSANTIDAAMADFNDSLKYNFGRQEIREQMTVFASQVAVGSSVPADHKRQASQAALLEMNKQIAETPFDARVYVFRATARRVAGDLSGAWKDYEKTRELSPQKQSLLLKQGEFAYVLGEKRLAAELFIKAYALDESFSETAAYAAAGLISIGNIKEGQAILQKHFSTAFPEHPFVQMVYGDLP